MPPDPLHGRRQSGAPLIRRLMRPSPPPRQRPGNCSGPSEARAAPSMPSRTPAWLPHHGWSGSAGRAQEPLLPRPSPGNATTAAAALKDCHAEGGPHSPQSLPVNR
ncbi:hypothetical protein ACFFX0_27030 [Citricoccus parietis]|uniref:Uncharacterized protein n=1 Tax=Citricoccus parietis TaxID=592307 RepID=A0ABV5G6S2_9MICC